LAGNQHGGAGSYSQMVRDVTSLHEDAFGRFTERLRMLKDM
jgi:hypothetical protein